MAKGISRPGMKNREYVRKLLREKQPEFSAALELACEPGATGAKVTGDPARRQRFRDLVTSNVTSLGTAADLAQAIAGRVYFIQSAGCTMTRPAAIRTAALPEILPPQPAKGSG